MRSAWFRESEVLSDSLLHYYTTIDDIFIMRFHQGSCIRIKRVLRYMYILGYLYRFGKKIVITKHAYDRANKRGIAQDMIEATINAGKIKRFGKNRIRFVKEYKHGRVVCVDEIKRNCIIIVTIEWKR